MLYPWANYPFILLQNLISNLDSNEKFLKIKQKKNIQKIQLSILGLEPKTHGLKGRRSTIELYTLIFFFRKEGNRTPVLKFEASYFTTKLLSFVFTPYRNPTYVFDVKSRRPSTRRREPFFLKDFRNKNSGWKDLNLRSSASKAGTLSQLSYTPFLYTPVFLKFKAKTLCSQGHLRLTVRHLNSYHFFIKHLFLYFLFGVYSF